MRRSLAVLPQLRFRRPLRPRALPPLQGLLVGLPPPLGWCPLLAAPPAPVRGEGVRCAPPPLWLRLASRELVRARSGGSEATGLRDYGVGAQILLDLGVRQMILLHNTEWTIVGLDGYGLKVLGQQSIPPSALGNDEVNG